VQVAGKYGKANRETSFTAKGLSKEGANKYMFAFTDRASGQEKQMSVAAYFTSVLGIKLQFPALQCVTVCPLSTLLIHSSPTKIHFRVDFMLSTILAAL
jgi:hypothetical protein